MHASLYPVKNGHSEKPGEGFDCRSLRKSGFNTERKISLNY